MIDEGEDKLISDEEMAQLEMLLPSRAFQQFKVSLYELLEKVKAGDYEGVNRFRDNLADQMGALQDGSEQFAKTVRQFGRGREAGFSRVRMQSMFLDRVARMMKGKTTPEEIIVGFPIGKVVKAEKKTEKKPEKKPEKIPVTPVKPVTPAIAEKPKVKPTVEPVSSALPDLRKAQVQSAKIKAKPAPKAVLPALEDIPVPKKVVKKKAKPPPTKRPARKEELKAPAPPKKKPKKDLAQYYKERQKHVREAIEEDQQQGARIRFKEGEEFDSEEPDGST